MGRRDAARDLHPRERGQFGLLDEAHGVAGFALNERQKVVGHWLQGQALDSIVDR